MLALLVVDAAVSAVVELFFLPLRFDGALLPDLGGVPFPATAVLAAVGTPLLVRTAARLAPRLPVAGAPLAAWLATVLVFGFFGPGGDAVLVGDWRALLLLAGGALPAAVVLGGEMGRAQQAAAQRAADHDAARRPGVGTRTGA
ncbi:hypothetical protein GTS_16000 [Gandjariella thermophila]|uniref:Uncharacterized protein n=1 Tax=Gandjariella thermophila TaxID=1931992 RepID=A0A4D4J7N5_9PSEU|nr:hypothetical protein GTS_16000 [Gandjariella thermophila]